MPAGGGRLAAGVHSARCEANNIVVYYVVYIASNIVNDYVVYFAAVENTVLVLCC